MTERSSLMVVVVGLILVCAIRVLWWTTPHAWVFFLVFSRFRHLSVLSQSWYALNTLLSSHLRNHVTTRIFPSTWYFHYKVGGGSLENFGRWQVIKRSDRITGLKYFIPLKNNSFVQRVIYNITKIILSRVQKNR